MSMTIEELRAECTRQDGVISDLEAEIERLTEELYNLEEEKREQVGAFAPRHSEYHNALQYIAREVGDIVYRLEQAGIRIRIEPSRELYYDYSNQFWAGKGGNRYSSLTVPVWDSSSP